MSARAKARRRALDVLYASDLRGESAAEALDRAIADGQKPNNPYTATIIRGVTEHQAHLDALLGRYSTSWTVERMPAIDRNVLRLGLWELLHADDVPDGVVISEAVALVRELSTDDSPQFVQGLLSALVRNRADLTAPDAPAEEPSDLTDDAADGA